MTQKDIWQIVNRRFIAKSIGELSYEQLFLPEVEDIISDSLYQNYRLELASGAVYRFKAWKSAWDHLRVNPKTISKENENIELNAGQFFIDAKIDLELTDLILGNYLEEVQSTIYSDVQLYLRQMQKNVGELANLDGDSLQAFLDGHPKILPNKGRLGWGVTDLYKYSPETAKPFQVHWVAVLKNDAIHDELSASEMSSFYENELGTSLYCLFLDTVKNLGKNPNDYLFLPIHPWQWDKIIRIQFLEKILNESLIDLGVQGDFYLPQISIRTLSNISDPKRNNLKLPISILNTSAVRGISSRYIGVASKVAIELSNICEQDFFLKKSNTLVLEDKMGISVQQQEYAKVAEAPYRYKETLGAIWRESSNVKINSDEKAVLTATLFHQDLSGSSLIGEYIRKSGITTDEWLSLYFSHVVLPLYHLQLKYGLGLVAHGQNIVLRLKNYKPSGLLLKDFQGDLRVNAEIIKNKYPKEHVFYHLDQLPSHYLIHDLITGHFVTVLRFVSEVLQESENYSENKFYSLLEKSLKDYMKEHCHTEVDLKVNLLKEKIERVLLNKVRFKIGYGDSSVRPLPTLGTDLNNPISYRGEYES